MKNLLLCVSVLAALSASAAYQEYHCAKTSGSYDWTDPATWVENAVPDSPDAYVVITGHYDGGSVNLSCGGSLGSATAAFIYVQNANAVAPGNWPTIITDGTLIFTNNNDMSAWVVDTSTGLASSPLQFNTSLTVPVDQTISFVVSNKPVLCRSAFTGSGTVRAWHGQLTCSQAGTDNTSPDFAGTIEVCDGAILYFNGEDCFTNPLTTIVVKDGGELLIRGAQSGPTPACRVNCPLIIEDGGTLNTQAGAHGAPSNIVASTYTVIGENIHTTSTKQKDLEFWGDVQGTGTIRKTGGTPLTTNRFLGSISPGFSAGTLTMNEQSGWIELGLPSNRLTLNIENEDLLEMINMDLPVDLANMDLVILTPMTATNWFLTADGGIANTFNSVALTNGLVGNVIYDYGNNRVGAQVVPEPAALAALALAIAAVVRVRGSGLRE